MKKYTLTFIIVFYFSTTIFAQAINDSIKYPIQRQLVHDKIRAEQVLLDKSDGKRDGLIKVSDNNEINLAVTDVLFRGARTLEDSIETNKKIPNQREKVYYLNNIQRVLNAFRIDWKTGKLNPVYAPMLLENFKQIMAADIDSLSMYPLIQNMPYAIAKINSEIFATNKGYKQSKLNVYLKFCKLYPDKILQNLSAYTNEPFADSLLIIAAKIVPSEVYKYAQDPSGVIGNLIHQSNNNILKNISLLSSMPSSLLYFPFLDDIVNNKKQIDDIKKIIGNGESGMDFIAYYKLLVQTEIDYSKRIIQGDTPIAFYGVNGLRNMLQNKAKQYFITPINELHEKPETVRMKAIEPLSSVDIYYMIVTNDDEIYTSSYKHSFNRMLQRMGKNVSTDSLLASVNYDYFKKFIKMAANFNKLDTFLNLMPNASSEKIMNNFVANLEITNSLEDAVDVADSYSSINNKKLLANILISVKENQQRCAELDNRRGVIIYNLLDTIFLSADSLNKIDLSTSIGIPPIYSIDNKSLIDDSGRIIQQTFFYGDEDGKSYFPQYIASFSNKEWKINSSNKEWVEIKSIKKPQIIIYVNKPLDSDKNLDDTAQIHLIKYLNKNNLKPTIVTHRGHSYWLPGTMARMIGDAKVIVLGSCGGYKNLNQLIDINPDAHIVSTKEIGTGSITQVICNNINQNLLQNKPIIWRTMWTSLNAYFTKQPGSIKEAWDDYIPPYKNLGAIFIKAYNKKAETE